MVTDEKREQRREYMREYYQRPEVKERIQKHMREYSQRPEVKERIRKRKQEYYQLPRVKKQVRKRRREYSQRPEVKERMREYMREYNQLPEAKERHRLSQHQYRQKPGVREHYREYYHKNNPFKYQEEVMGTKTRALTQEEFSAYIQVVQSATGKETVVAAICSVIIGTGARIGEVLTMCEADLFDPFGNPLPRITRTLEKKRGVVCRKTVDFLWPELGDPIKCWRLVAKQNFGVKRKSPFFTLRYSGNPVTQQHCRTVNARFLAQAGINPAGVAFHGIRKSFLSLMYYQRLKTNNNNFMSALRYVQGLAGHASFETTLHYLADVIECSHVDILQEAFETLARNSHGLKRDATN